MPPADVCPPRFATRCSRSFASRWAISLALGVALAATALIAPATAQPTTQTTTPGTERPATPDYAPFTSSYRIPFTRPLNFDRLSGMHVRVSLNGGPATSMQVDTGSVGVIIADDEIPDFDPNNGEPGSILYSSSGIELVGVWTPTTITFVDSDDGHGNKATAVVPVLAVSRRVIHPGAVNASTRPAASQPTTKPRPHMFGIGFGRGKEPHQERNPWVNLKEMNDGAMRRGYTITRNGYTLGLTGSGVGDGYVFEALKERAPSTQMAIQRPGLKDWESSRGWVTVDGKDEPNAAMLYDTGLTNFMIGKPDATRDQQDVPDGVPVTVHLLSGKLAYSFKVQSTTQPATPVTPRRVTVVKRDSPTVNTGLRALANFDYLYDADGGYLGLRPTREQK